MTGWGEKKVGRKRIEEREEERRPNPRTIPLQATSLSAGFFLVNPAAVRPFHPEVVYRPVQKKSCEGLLGLPKWWSIINHLC